MINLKIKYKNIIESILFIYFISISAFQRGHGFDAIIVRVSFVLLIFIVGVYICKNSIKISKHTKWAISFWVLYFLSIIWAKNQHDVLMYINNCLQIIGLSICLSNYINTNDDINKVLKLLVYSLVFTSILLIIRTPMNAWGTERVGSVIGLHSNGLGMRLAFGAIIALYLFNKNNKIIYLECVFLFSCLLLFTGSKKAIVILVLGILLYELLINKGLKLVLKITILAFVFIFLFNIIMNNEVLYQVIGKRIEYFILTVRGTSTIDASTIERQFFINSAKELFSRNLLLGYGGNNFMTYMREINYSQVVYSHNNYWEILSTLGVVGFIVYYVFWIKTLISLLKKYLCDRKNRLTILFIGLIIITLAMDYANVSYINEFTQLILILGYCSFKVS